MPTITSANPGRGAAWLLNGFEYFRQSPGAWIGTILIMVVITVVSGFVPFASLLLQLFMPVFVGGLILGCRDIEGGGGLMMNHLFAGFGRDTGNLLLLGVLYTLGVFIIFIIMSIIFVSLVGTEALQAAMAGEQGFFAAHARDILLASLIGLMLYLPLLMALWFSPVLVVLEGQKPLEAVRLSFAGCLKNIVPFLVYGLVSIPLAILASLPFMLGWFILTPMIIASLYLAYREIYQFTPAGEPV